MYWEVLKCSDAAFSHSKVNVLRVVPPVSTCRVLPGRQRMDTWWSSVTQSRSHRCVWADCETNVSDTVVPSIAADHAGVFILDSAPGSAFLSSPALTWLRWKLHLLLFLAALLLKHAAVRLVGSQAPTWVSGYNYWHPTHIHPRSCHCIEL